MISPRVEFLLCNKIYVHKKENKTDESVLPLAGGCRRCILRDGLRYGVMTVKGLRPEEAMLASSAGGRQMMVWLDLNGFKLMMIELGVLAITTRRRYRHGRVLGTKDPGR